MKLFVDIVVETSNPSAAIGRLNSFGLDKGDGIRLYAQTLTDIGGTHRFKFRVFKDRLDQLPTNYNDTFTVIWRSDEQDPPVPWPECEVINYDIDGNPDGTRMQGVGRIA